MRLSLVIPCYNEAASLPELGRRCLAALQAEPGLDIILVDNGSTDGSAEAFALLEPHPRLAALRVSPNRGYGGGILAGLAAAKGEALGWTHADLQTDPMDAVRGLEVLRRSADPGRTYVKGRRKGWPLGDAAFTWGMSAFETVLLGAPLVDINAQPNLFPRALYEGWASAPEDFSLDLYAYHSAKAAGLAVARFPVEFGARRHGRSHWNVDWRSKARFIGRTVRFSLELRRSLAGRGGERC